MNFLTDFLSGDLEVAAKNMHPDFVASIPESLPWGGEWHGRAGCVGLLTKINELVAVEGTAEPRFLHVPADGTVIALLHANYTSRATGKSLPIRLLEVYDFTDGLISGVSVFFQDTHRMIDELGLTRS
ncbi:nuclear transport factor 2 family protein [Streptomyces sp. NPDC051985]|uniref:nuclear transport factor 2 family protein n=1 Tax=Streptomyces sp. NPDC051985 TaxID=3155807 RepID=UPI0034326BD5